MTDSRLTPLNASRAIRVNRLLYLDVCEMLRVLDDGRSRRRTGQSVPYGAIAELADTLLRDWLTVQNARLRERDLRLAPHERMET